MSKKTSKTPFFYYMMEYKDRMSRKGQIITIQEASEKSSVSWNRMSAEQRAAYDKMAKVDKLSDRPSLERLTSQGIPMALIKEQQDNIIAEQIQMEKTIKEIVQTSYINNCIGDQPHFIVMGNYFCKLSNGEYFPAELALIKYTIKDGISAKQHKYLKKDSLPLGYAYPAKQLSEDTHLLPIPPHAKGEQNWKDVLHWILDFITIDGVVFPLYTLPVHMPMIKSFIRQFCQEDENYSDPKLLPIYSLTYLFFMLKSQTCKYAVDNDDYCGAVGGGGGDGFHDILMTQAILDHNLYDYASDIACDYHEENDVSKYCALALCTRWSYTISNHVCSDLNIKFIRGQHVPPNVDVFKGLKNYEPPSIYMHPTVSRRPTASIKMPENTSSEEFVKNSNNNDEDDHDGDEDTFTNDVDVITSKISALTLPTNDDFPALGTRRKIKKKNVQCDRTKRTSKSVSNEPNIADSTVAVAAEQEEDGERRTLLDSDAQSKRTGNKRGHGRGRKRFVTK